MECILQHYQLLQSTAATHKEELEALRRARGHGVILQLHIPNGKEARTPGWKEFRA